MRRRPPVYPIFLSFAGCPFRCIYCDQQAVTAVKHDQSWFERAIARLVSLAERIRVETVPGEIAFYGGTFTGLPLNLRDQLLKRAAGYVREGLFTGIRFSTRPDMLDADTLGALSQYPITTVELGIQSLSDPVLEACHRGYSRDQAVATIECLRQYPWKLGVQLMSGLPADTPKRFLDSVLDTIARNPDFVRFYPVLVFPGTELAQWTADGRYQPLTVDEAVAGCVPAFDACLQAGIPVARMGLLLSSGIDSGMTSVAGPWHPAFGQLVRSAWWRQRIDETLEQWPSPPAGGCINLRVGQRHVGDVLGWKRQNLTHWRQKWDLKQMSVEGITNEDGRGFVLALNARED
jgi:histone acetyltransferase (RNA polymerase elongator complex component)